MRLYMVRNLCTNLWCMKGKVMTHDEALSLHFRLGDAQVPTEIVRVA